MTIANIGGCCCKPPAEIPSRQTCLNCFNPFVGTYPTKFLHWTTPFGVFE